MRPALPRRADKTKRHTAQAGASGDKAESDYRKFAGAGVRCN